MQIQGSIPVTGFIAPTDSTDTYPVTDTIFGIDGLRNVSGSTERDSISLERRRAGMLVGTQDDQNIWKLLPGPWTQTSTDWQLFISSGATSLLTAGTASITATTASNGLTITNNNITLGGVLTGDTYINNSGFQLRADVFSATTLSAQTINLESTTSAQIIMSPVNASSPVDGSMWFTTSGGTTVLNYQVSGITKSVELT